MTDQICVQVEHGDTLCVEVGDEHELSNDELWARHRALMKLLTHAKYAPSMTEAVQTSSAIARTQGAMIERLAREVFDE